MLELCGMTPSPVCGLQVGGKMSDLSSCLPVLSAHTERKIENQSHSSGVDDPFLIVGSPDVPH